MDLRRFEGKSVIVTGASQGIGKAVAERFASEGAEVMVTGRRAEVLDSVVAGIAAAGGSASAFTADVSDPADVAASVKAAIAIPKCDPVSGLASTSCVISWSCTMVRSRPPALALEKAPSSL